MHDFQPERFLNYLTGEQQKTNFKKKRKQSSLSSHDETIQTTFITEAKFTVVQQ